MHKFLRAIGFSKFDTRKKIKSLIKACVLDATEKKFTENGEETMLAEYCKDFSPDFGIAVCGELSDDSNKFSYDYYYPYLRNPMVSSDEDISIERHSFQQSYVGICDDIRVGATLIFYLQNMIDYVRINNAGGFPVRGTNLCLSALSIHGMILMPIQKSEEQKKSIKRKSNRRYELIRAARNGDEKAIESLSLDDIDTYSFISRKIRSEDIFTIVDSYFMPYGVEYNEFSILGEIADCKKVKNELTGEYVYVMNINCNELYFKVCINEKDVYGEPEAGRRFKGHIWLQGYINFSG